MFKAYNLLSKHKDFKVIKGFFRNLEVTYNKEQDTYHPHFHIILVVDSTYFKGGYYLSQKKWTELWRSCLRVDYTPVVDIRRIKANTKKQKVKVIVEISKYAVKDSDYIIYDYYNKLDLELLKKVVYTLDICLASRRLSTYHTVEL